MGIVPGALALHRGGRSDGIAMSRHDANGDPVARQAYIYGKRVAKRLTRYPDIW
jgi:hypothetical protein